MPQYEYQAKKGPTDIVKGTIEAVNENAAIHALADQGIIPLSIKDSKDTHLKKKGILLHRVTGQDIAMFTFQLQELLAAGLTLHNALATVQTQLSNQRLQTIIADCSDKVTSGTSFSEALQSHDNVFSSLYINMVKAGEASGNLEKVLEQLAEVYEREYDFQNRIKQALAYPAFIVLAGIATVIAILAFVIPRLQAMYDDIGQSLPFITTVVIKTSVFLQHFWWLIIVGIAAIGIVFYKLNEKKQLVNVLFDSCLLKLPIWGEVLHKEEVVRFARSMGMLLQSGITILDAITISRDVLRSGQYKDAILRIHNNVQQGKHVNEAMREEHIFSAMVINMIATGEKSGTLDRSFLRIVHMFEKQIDTLVKMITTLLEPILVLAIGLVVGVIVISMLLPIFQINIFVS